ncbi:MAG: DUF4945 domain-containing protein [Fermentimonas sp.]|nr:DUF4945 domain-containing protein [Fermentimonas sp.]
MKYIVKLFIVTLSIVILTGCYDRDIIDRKDFNHSLPIVTNLSVSQQNNIATITWQIPSDISDSFRRPIEVSIQVVEDDIYRQNIAVFDEATSREIEIDPAKEYKFIVKLLGFLTPDAKEDGFTDRVFSEGVIIEL